MRLFFLLLLPVFSCLREYQQSNDDFKEFVDTLQVALRQKDDAESPVRQVHQSGRGNTASSAPLSE
jgi:hypothetical protein